MRLTIEQLITEGDCDKDCNPKCMMFGKPICCSECRKGHYVKGEIDERQNLNIITKEEADYIKKLKVFSIGEGCILPRRMRSRFCMEWECK